MGNDLELYWSRRFICRDLLCIYIEVELGINVAIIKGPSWCSTTKKCHVAATSYTKTGEVLGEPRYGFPPETRRALTSNVKRLPRYPLYTFLLQIHRSFKERSGRSHRSTRMEDDPLRSRESPLRQNSAISAASSGGKTARPTSSSGKPRRGSVSNGGIFARLRGTTPTGSSFEISNGRETPTEAGPSDWYRRSPSPDGVPSTWRTASPDVGRYEFEEGPSDIWAEVDSPGRSRVDSPFSDEKEYQNRMAVLPDQEAERDEEVEEVDKGRHPAEVDLERGGNQATSNNGTGTDKDDDSDFGARVVSFPLLT